MVVGFEPGREGEVLERMKEWGLKVVDVYGPGRYIVCQWPAGFRAAEGGPEKAAATLEMMRGVRYAVPNLIFEVAPPEASPRGNGAPAAAPASAPTGTAPSIATYANYAQGPRYGANDPYFARLWGMDAVRATRAWGRTQNAAVIVAVTDSGVDYRHEDLAANIYRNPYEIPADGLDNDGNGVIDDVVGFDATTQSGDPIDRFGHGTHCAGTVGAVGNNGIGVTGVNWGVKIMPVKVMDDTGHGDVDWAVKGIDYAWRNGAKVISASWGWPLSTPRSFMQPIYEAVARAEAAGVLFVAAAGNDHRDVDVHAHYPSSFADPNDPSGQLGNVISVAAIDIHEGLSNFSNFGTRSVLLAAPGGHVTADANGETIYNEEDILSTMSQVNQWPAGAVRLDGGKYAYSSGTSMATPHVSGGVALLWSLPEYRQLGPQEIKRLVLSQTRRLESLKGRCATEGVLDLSFLNPEAPATPYIPVAPDTSNYSYFQRATRRHCAVFRRR
jgi:subtilisin family serine protease